MSRPLNRSANTDNTRRNGGETHVGLARERRGRAQDAADHAAAEASVAALRGRSTALAALHREIGGDVDVHHAARVSAEHISGRSKATASIQWTVSLCIGPAKT